MKVYDVIDTAQRLRPGNEYDADIVERWIAECDASIQLEVARKRLGDIRPLRPPVWENRAYRAGDKVSESVSGKWRVYMALMDMDGTEDPATDREHWTEVPYETYVGFPHDRLYYLHVIAMMDYANMEYDKYANDRALYEAAIDEYSKWWQRQYSNTYTEGSDQYEADIRGTK
jgi:hypothetical protein